MSLKDVEERARKQEEQLRRAHERGQVASVKAKLEKKLSHLKNQLMSGEDGEDLMGTGKQVSLMGLGEYKIVFLIN